MIFNRLYWTTYLALNSVQQKRYPYKALKDIERARERRLRYIVDFAFKNVPFYKELKSTRGIKPEDIQTTHDLQLLPLIEHRNVQENPLIFVSETYPLRNLLHLRTGGSTGEPKDIYHDTRSLFQSAVHGERGAHVVTKQIGKRFGYKEVMFAPGVSSIQEVSAFWHAKAWIPSPFRIKRRWLSLFHPTEKNVRLINEFQPDVIFCYGSYLELLFYHLETTGETMHRPQAIIYSSDTLSETVRKIILNKYRIPVFGWYQTVEAPKIAFECEQHEGLHLNIDYYDVRIVDDEGNPVSEGDEGEIVISNLYNRGTVLLNYKIGDVGRMIKEPCPCGRTLPRLSFPQGRADDFLETTGGVPVHSQQIGAVFLKYTDVLQFQVQQTTPAHVRVELVVKPDTDRDAIAKDLSAEFKKILGAGVVINVHFVDSVSPTEVGKRRRFISEQQRTKLRNAFNQ